MADKLKKCENPACSCTADAGQDYCSAHCESMEGNSEVVCRCGHASCQGEAVDAPETVGSPMTT